MVGLGNVVGGCVYTGCCASMEYFLEIRNICLYCKRRRKGINRD